MNFYSAATGFRGSFIFQLDHDSTDYFYFLFEVFVVVQESIRQYMHVTDLSILSQHIKEEH